MGKEIERKYLVKDDSYLHMASGNVEIVQGYLSADADATVRVRLWGDKGRLTVKSRNRGAVRGEWEYSVPESDAREMLGLCGSRVLEKTRYQVPFCGRIWEVDVFHGRHTGLVLAEVELDSETQAYELPPFVGTEVTGDPRYYNSNLF